MAALSDFNKPVQKPKLSDFFATGATKRPVLSPASINNVAANAAAVDVSGDMNSTYLKVSDELNYGTSPIATRVLQTFDDMDHARNYESLMDIAADPSLSIEQREAAVKGFAPPGSDRIYRSFFERTASAASMENSEDDDNDETEFVRLDTTNVLNEVDAYQGWVQKELNRLDNLSNPGALQTMAQMVMTMVPFYEQLSNAKVSSEVLGEDGQPSIAAVAQSLT